MYGNLGGLARRAFSLISVHLGKCLGLRLVLTGTCIYMYLRPNSVVINMSNWRGLPDDAVHGQNSSHCQDNE